MTPRAKASEPRASALGLTEYFRPGEQARVRRALDDMAALGVTRLRTALSWAQWHAPGGPQWYDWLLPRLAARVEVLPMVHYTPPSLGVAPKSSAPPRRPRDYADFIDTVITRYGRYFDYLELWNEPNNVNDWDYLHDPDWAIFCDMVGAAAYWAQKRGKKTVLPGTCPTDSAWIDLMGRRGVLACIDVVGLHAFPGTWDFDGRSWDQILVEVRAVLERHGLSRDIWITETGYSTWRHDDINQARRLLAALDALGQGVGRVYWYSLHDLSPELPSQEGFHEDERHYHTGLCRHDGAQKLLFRLLAQGGPAQVEHACGLCRPWAEPTPPAPPLLLSARPARSDIPIAAAAPGSGPALVLGAGGSLGAALARRLLAQGRCVAGLDNLSRPDSEARLQALAQDFGQHFYPHLADVRDRYALRRALAGVDTVFALVGVDHLPRPADPARDCDTLIRGSLLLLEELRGLARPPLLIYASTFRVYQSLPREALVREPTRFAPRDPNLRAHGIPESHPLDLSSLTACHHAAAEGYVLTYAKAHGLAAAVLRLGRVLTPGETPGLHPATLDGAGPEAGRVVRDYLALPDCLKAFRAAEALGRSLAGRALNVGGGPANAASLLELAAMAAMPRPDALQFDPADPAALPGPAYYVSDHRLFTRLTGWRPHPTLAQGTAVSAGEGDADQRSLAQARVG